MKLLPYVYSRDEYSVHPVENYEEIDSTWPCHWYATIIHDGAVIHPVKSTLERIQGTVK